MLDRIVLYVTCAGVLWLLLFGGFDIDVDSGDKGRGSAPISRIL